MSVKSTLSDDVEKIRSELQDLRDQRHRLVADEKDTTSIDADIERVQQLLSKRKRRVGNNVMSFREFVEENKDILTEDFSSVVQRPAQVAQKVYNTSANAINRTLLKRKTAELDQTFAQIIELCKQTGTKPIQIAKQLAQDGNDAAVRLFNVRAKKLALAPQPTPESFGAFMGGASDEIKRKLADTMETRIKNSHLGKFRQHVDDIMAAGRAASEYADSPKGKQENAGRKLNGQIKRFSNLSTQYAKIIERARQGQQT